MESTTPKTIDVAQVSPPGLPAPLPKANSPVAITSTWDGVRHWLNAAKMFEQGKLFSQVMIGFELLALRKAHGTNQGKRRDLRDTTSPQAAEKLTSDQQNQGNAKLDWPELVKKEAGISDDTAARYMDLAKAATPRLKKLPALKNFDPLAMPLAQLPAPQKSAMEKAVRKLTDGRTQTDFFAALYKQPNKGNPNATGGKARKLTAEEETEKLKEIAVDRAANLNNLFQVSAGDFFLLDSPDDPDDLALNTIIANGDHYLRLVRAWLAMPKGKRDPNVIAKLRKEHK